LLFLGHFSASSVLALGCGQFNPRKKTSFTQKTIPLNTQARDFSLA
jgi:hypothetical protein